MSTLATLINALLPDFSLFPFLKFVFFVPCFVCLGLAMCCSFVLALLVKLQVHIHVDIVLQTLLELAVFLAPI